MKAGEKSAEYGFAIHRELFSAGEMGSLATALRAETLERSRAGARHMLGKAAVARLAHDNRLMNLASNCLGAAAIPFRATLFDKSPDANWLVPWHQDTAVPIESRIETPGWGPWSQKMDVTYAHAPAHVLERIVALRVHIDDSADGSGPLRVLPGTHRMGVLSDEQVSELAKRSQAVSCCAPAGSVVVMRPLVIHASSKAATEASRRVLHLEYATSLYLENELRLRIV